MLCALASAQRQQTLSALDLNFRKESRDSISFVVTDRLKTSRPGKSIEITFSSSGCASICPLAALKEYISRSETLRFRSGHFVSKLVLSFIRQEGGGDSIVFELRLLTHSSCQCDVT